MQSYTASQVNLQTYTLKFKNFKSILSFSIKMNRMKIASHGLERPIVVLYGLLWSFMILYGISWYCMTFKWSCNVLFGLVWLFSRLVLPFYVFLSRGHRSKFIWSCSKRDFDFQFHFCRTPLMSRSNRIDIVTQILLKHVQDYQLQARKEHSWPFYNEN